MFLLGSHAFDIHIWILRDWPRLQLKIGCQDYTLKNKIKTKWNETKKQKKKEKKKTKFKLKFGIISIAWMYSSSSGERTDPVVKK